MKGWEPNCPYNPSGLVLNLEGVTSWNKAPKSKTIMQWHPPPPRTWKRNVDESAKGKLGPTSIGGVLCDDKGCILAKFAASVGTRDSNEA